MNTDTACLSRIAYSAALPVSPDVAPRIFKVWPRSVSTCSNSCPSICMAMSLNASVGPLGDIGRAKLLNGVGVLTETINYRPINIISKTRNNFGSQFWIRQLGQTGQCWRIDARDCTGHGQAAILGQAL